MKKEKNIYSPSPYNVRRNATKAMQGELEDIDDTIANADVLVMEINKEKMRHRKSDAPSAPLNARKEPKAINIKKEHHSVYDEIALRHKSQSSEPVFPVEQQPEDVDVKIYSRSKFSQPDSDYDVIQEYEEKKKSHRKLWVALITILVLMCVAVGGLYAYQMGMLDGLEPLIDWLNTPLGQ
jgi:hypothetical protein